jgi:alkylhydroperoxidase/carboxymuconolactone decarboxylase family protein YurZ
MYSRWILDDKTRLLCTTADCLALGAGAAESARDHMEEALHFGNSPREVFEVVLMSGLFFGFPGMSAARAALFGILKEQGRLDEL